MFIIEALNSRRDLIQWSERQSAPLRWTLYVVAVFIIFLYGSFGVENFIYVQF